MAGERKRDERGREGRKEWERKETANEEWLE